MLNTIFFYTLMFAVVGTPFYFRYRIEEMGVTEETIEKIEGISAKLTTFVIGALFVMGFIGIQTRSSTLQEAAFFTCLFSFILLQSQHGKTVNQFRNTQQTPEERFRGSFRNFSTFLLLYGFYFVTVELLIPHLGTIPSITLSVLVITYCVPLLIRISIPSTAMYPSTLKNEIKSVFQNAGTTVGQIYLIDSDHTRGCNAFVCGPRFGFGPFCRSLFITKNMFELLEPEEIKAVICHEAAHFKLNHIFKRGLFSIGVLLLMIAVILFPFIFISTLMHLSPGPRSAAVLASTVFTVYAQVFFLMKLTRKQEFEADQEAVQIGCHPGALIQALEKITKLNRSSRKKPEGILKYISFNTHPGIDERIEALVRGKVPADANLVPSWQMGLSYASFVVLAATLAFAYQSGKLGEKAAQRSIASEKPMATATRQILPPPQIPIKWEDEASDE